MKKSLKRILSMLLVLAMFTGFSIPGYAAGSSSYENDIALVWKNFERAEDRANTANSQIINGRLRTVDYLEIIAKELDTDGKKAKSISKIMIIPARKRSCA